MKSQDDTLALHGETTPDRWRALIRQKAGLGSSSAGEERADECNLLEWSRSEGVSLETESRATASILGVPFVDDLTQHRPAPIYLSRFPIAFARQQEIMVFESEDGVLSAALSDVRNWSQLDGISRCLRTDVDPFFAPSKQIQDAVNAAYQEQSGQAQNLLDTMDRSTVLDELDALCSREDLLDVSGRAPVIKLVNLILFEAVKERASDVHVHPYQDRLVVRLRTDGVLFDAFDIPKGIQEEVISRLKVVGDMDIAEKRLPQDGRATVRVGDRQIDLRIASLPTNYGERIVIRLLDRSARLYTLAELGMDPETHRQFRELIHLEHGLILVTGPTGSGKSTTLYAALQEINAVDRNVITLEDPIEYQIDGISQTQINEKTGMTFAKGLRNVLRQDPDIIMVGEIRDQETAVMAIQSALTGHLVFSTLHTNDASSAVTRMLDLGIEPYLLSSSLMAVMAQRLVRQVCGSCGEQHVLTEEEKRKLGAPLDPPQVLTGKRGNGCPRCRQTGFAGRVGLFELLIAQPSVRANIQARANATEIRDDAVSQGMRLLRDDGLRKVLAGSTTTEEVTRVTARTSL